MRRKTNAFTLIELSIVLVVIGLIAGGIVAGQKIIRAAQIRSVISDVQKYTIAYDQFRSQYSALPGDMSNATTYWSTASNGNGNNIIDNGGSPEEDTFSWQHLALAGLVSGTFTADTGGYSSAGALKAAHLRSALPGTYSGAYWNLFTHSAQFGITTDGLHLGSLYDATGSNAWRVWASVLTPTESYQLDLKVDDGQPSHGKLVVYEGGDFTAGNTCIDQSWVSATQATTVNYRLTTISTSCRLYFRISPPK